MTAAPARPSARMSRSRLATLPGDSATCRGSLPATLRAEKPDASGREASRDASLPEASREPAMARPPGAPVQWAGRRQRRGRPWRRCVSGGSVRPRPRAPPGAPSPAAAGRSEMPAFQLPKQIPPVDRRRRPPGLPAGPLRRNPW